MVFIPKVKKIIYLYMFRKVLQARTKEFERQWLQQQRHFLHASDKNGGNISFKNSYFKNFVL